MLPRVVRRVRLALARTLFALRRSLGRRPTLGLWRAARATRRRERGCDVAVVLVSIAFNNPTVIRLQHDLIRSNVVDGHVWLVADNSSDRAARRGLRALCRRQGVVYAPLPRNPYTGRNPSRSHAEALNLVARHLLHRVAAPVIGFLDHDVFPVRPTSIVERMGGAVAYGRFQERGGVWYLWPGLLFLRRRAVDVGALDFHPWGGGDTGAGLHPLIYRDLPEEQVVLTTSDTRPFTSDVLPRYEVFDDWVHTVNASYWKPTARKDESIEDLLEQLARGGG